MLYLIRSNLILNGRYFIHQKQEKPILLALTRLNSSINSSDFDSVKKRSATKTRNNIPPPIDLKSVRTNEQINDSNKNSDSRTSFRLVALALLAIPLATFGLGCWQVKRREWKLDLINFLESRSKQEPRDLPSDPAELEHLVEANEYCRFKVKGRFLHSKEILVSPRHDLTLTHKVPGAHVVTPLVLSNNSNLTILVNRGFVPYMKYSPTTRQEGQVEGEVEVVGILRDNEITNSFTPENKPPHEWHYRDVNQMARSLNTAPLFLDAVETSSVKGGPVGGQSAINIRNEHMSYIITWFSLSALTTFMWFRKFVLKK